MLLLYRVQVYEPVTSLSYSYRSSFNAALKASHRVISPRHGTDHHDICTSTVNKISNKIKCL